MPTASATLNDKQSYFRMFYAFHQCYPYNVVTSVILRNRIYLEQLDGEVSFTVPSFGNSIHLWIKYQTSRNMPPTPPPPTLNATHSIAAASLSNLNHHQFCLVILNNVGVLLFLCRANESEIPGKRHLPTFYIAITAR